MGTLVTVSCKCGYLSETYVGYGMAGEDFCLFPALCEQYRNIVTSNYLSETNKCPECGSTRVVPYDHPSLVGDPGNREIGACDVAGDAGRVAILTDGGYQCHECGDPTLRFEECGLWD